MSTQSGWGAAEHPNNARTLRFTMLVVGVIVGGLAILFLLSLLPRVEAQLYPVAAVEGRVVYVTGTTDLPDGAVIGYYYVHQVASLEGHEPDGGSATVRDGRFDFHTDFTGWPGGTIVLYTEFGVGSGWVQPQAVIDRFGSMGERLSGPQAGSESGDPPTLQATATFVLPD